MKSVSPTSSTLYRLPLRLRSLRTRLILWNIAALALLLAIMGVLIQYSVRSNLLASVKRELTDRSRRMIDIPPPPPGDGPGSFPRHGDPRHFAPPPDGFGHGSGGPSPMPPPHEGPGNGFGDHPPPFGGMGGSPPPGPHRPRTIQEAAAEAKAQRLRPRLFNLEGKPLFPYGKDVPWDQRLFALSVQGKEGYATILVDDEPLLIYSTPFPRQGPFDGVLQAAYPLTDVYRALADMNRTLLTLIPVALLIAGLGGAFLTERALRPVRRLSQTAARIGAQDLSERLPVSGDDEFADLAATFNGMLGRLEAAFGRMENLLQQQRRFTADASHELRTPLTVIKANTSLTLSGAASESEYRQSIEEIDQAADTMSRLVYDLLLLARSDGGQLGRNRVSLPLREVLERAAGVCKSGSPPVRFEFPDSELYVLGNADELVRLFSNLLENAARYTPSEGQITIAAREEGAQVVVTVADTGAGIASEHLPHLCERFYRADTARARSDGGTGLGLAICKGIVEAHRGTMTFQSEVGVGTTVRVALPTSDRLF